MESLNKAHFSQASNQALGRGRSSQHVSVLCFTSPLFPFLIKPANKYQGATWTFLIPELNGKQSNFFTIYGHLFKTWAILVSSKMIIWNFKPVEPIIIYGLLTTILICYGILVGNFTTHLSNITPAIRMICKILVRGHTIYLSSILPAIHIY